MIHLSDLADVVLASAPHAGGGSFKDTIVKFFKDGGPFMFINLLVWTPVALAVIVERIVTLMFRYNLNAAPFMEQITKLVRGGNGQRALRLCDAAPNAPLSKVVKAGLNVANRGEVAVSRAMEEAILEHTPHITARIPWLWSLANIATLFGLIGTIVGLIGTFQSLGNVPADQKQALLSAGISEAMNNTAFGLSIAVFCIAFHLFLTAYAKSMVEAVELNALKLENTLANVTLGGAAAADSVSRA